MDQIKNKPIEITVGKPIIKSKKPDGQGESIVHLEPKDQLAINASFAQVAAGMKKGEKVTVEVDGQTVAVIKKEGEDNWRNFKTRLRDLGRMAVVTAQEAIEQDPSFIFRETAEIAKEKVLVSTPEAIKPLVQSGLFPAVRMGALMIDLKKAFETLKDKRSQFADKFIDVAHCLTDVGGLVGSAAHLLPPFPGGPVLIAVSVLGDIVAFGFHAVQYFLKKGSEASGQNPTNGTGGGGFSQKPDENKPPVPNPPESQPPAPTETGGAKT